MRGVFRFFLKRLLFRSLVQKALAEQSEGRVKRMKGLWKGWLAELNKEIGPLTGVEVLGTVPRIPDSYGEKTADNTTVLIKGQKGN